MKLTKITIRGMHNVDSASYNFKDFTYLYGMNGAGKSTVLQAVQLALLGYIPGTNKKPSDIFTHSNSSVMEVEAFLEDGDETYAIRRTYQKVGQSVKSSVVTIPYDLDIDNLFGSIELPIFNFSSFINQSPNALKNWFIDFLPKSNRKIEWKKWIKGRTEDSVVTEDLIQSINDYSSNVPKGLEGVKQLNEYLKSLRSAKEASVKALEGTISSLVKFDDYAGPDDTDYLNAKIKEARDKIIEAKSAKKHSEANKAARDRLSVYNDLADSIDNDADIPCWKIRIADGERAQAKLRDSLCEIDSAMYELKVSLRSLQLSGDGTCPYTNCICELAKSTIDESNNKADEIKENLSELEQKRDELSLQLIESEEVVDNLRKLVNLRTSEYSKRDFIRSTITDDPECNIDLEFYVNQEEQFTDMLRKLEANLQYEKLARVVTKDKFEAEQDVLALKKLIIESDSNHLQAELSNEAFVNLESDLTLWLRKLYSDNKVEAHFVLSDKSNSFDFGLIRDNKFITFNTLSSGEKCVFVFAMMLCLSYKSDTSLKLIVVDDSIDHLDDANANLVFESLQNIHDVQILLAGVKNCKLSDTSFITYI